MPPVIRPFHFARDTFAFRNELHWQYQFDAATGRMAVRPNQPPPRYAHRCFVLVRSVRQFLYHACFDPALSLADPRTYRRLIRQVVSRNPRQPSLPGQAIVIPGYDSLRSFSAAHEAELKAECGGPWASYFLRSHWRMVFPFSRRHQERTARQLAERTRQGWLPIAHLVRFPQLTINHGVAVCAAVEESGQIRFSAYDPNLPEKPVELFYDHASRTFSFPPTIYWGGGRVDVYEVYVGGLF